MEISHLPDEIGKLIHLRYLDLSRNFELQDLPNSFVRLINLQNLKLKFCQKLRQLPGEMPGMIHLRKFDIRGCDLLKYLPKGVGNWRSLRTLSEFIISGANDEGCKFEELKYLNLLKDDLKITGLNKLKATVEAELHKKSKLSGLVLDFKPREERFWYSRGDVFEKSSEDVLAVSVLEVLRPHSNLKKLTISNYLGFQFPSWMGSTEALTRLCYLDLKDCINCLELPALGLLQSLEVLRISRLLNLKRMGVEMYGGRKCITQVAFPKLITLEITRATNLEVWEFGNEEVQVGGIMPCITSIILEDCKTLKVLPALGKLPSLEILSINNSHQLESFGHEFCRPEGSSSISSLTAFPKLNSLTFGGLLNMEVMNLGELPCLKHLRIHGWDKLKSLRFRSNKSLPSLETLDLTGMRNLEEFHFGEVGEEEEENSVWQLPRLYKIQLQDCRNLKSFPRHLPRLRGLYANGFPSLLSGHQPYLPISPNLISLVITRYGPYGDHPQLQLGNIADFKKLEQLSIHGEPDELFGAGDWSILSYIPSISINNYKIDRLTYSSLSNQHPDEVDYVTDTPN